MVCARYKVALGSRPLQ